MENTSFYYLFNFLAGNIPLSTWLGAVWEIFAKVNTKPAFFINYKIKLLALESVKKKMVYQYFQVFHLNNYILKIKNC